jgi:hypothetical protein
MTTISVEVSGEESRWWVRFVASGTASVVVEHAHTDQRRAIHDAEQMLWNWNHYGTPVLRAGEIRERGNGR